MAIGLQWLKRYFHLERNQTTVATELRAGFTTFTALAYILMVNPIILGQAITSQNPDLFAQLLTTTALAAAFGSILMGLVANLPFALAPGMGLNAYFTYSVVIGLGLSWQSALGAVFFSGLAFLLISIVGLRKHLVFAIPHSLRYGTAAGVGLFIAFLGLKSGGLIVSNDATLVSLGTLSSDSALVFCFGLILTLSLMKFRVKGSILIGILASSTLAISLGFNVFQGQPYTGDFSLVAIPVWPSDLIGAFTFTDVFEMGLLSIVFIFLFVDLFDTTGSLFALSGQMEKFHPLSESDLAKSFGVDALATMLGAFLGTSSTTTYIESATGVEEGGRTGLTAVTVGLLFIAALFFWPLLKLVPESATAPALVIVGALMAKQIGKLTWDDETEYIPAFLCFILMPLSFSIANGIALGIISYVILKLTTGKFRHLNLVLIILSTLLLIRYIWY
ncbi:MAG: NCS2 family permease [Oligoflexus sp.]